MPHQWRHAKIIPLKKPGKADYTVGKAWRPISLLATPKYPQPISFDIFTPTTSCPRQQTPL